MASKNTIQLNGNEFSFEPGETILEVAAENSIDIPTLCHLKNTTPTGSCNVCVVEVKDEPDLLKACSTPASSGMVITTESPGVFESRKATIKLLLASGNHNCAVRGSDTTDWIGFQLSVQGNDQSDDLCPVWGDCQLQDLAYRYQVSAPVFDESKTPFPTETVNPFIVRDFSRCIKCEKCVKACNEIQVNNAISVGYKGSETKIVAADDKPLKDSDCVFCGECIQVCPVGALTEKDIRYRVRPWEMNKIRTTCSYCGVGCQIYLHVKDNRVVKVSGVEDTAPNFGSLCVKGRFGFDFINSPERLSSPLIRENGVLRKAGWDEALNLVADQFKSIITEHGADSIGVLTSARITNEDNYIVNKFTRAVLKTNNIDHCARL